MKSRGLFVVALVLALAFGGSCSHAQKEKEKEAQAKIAKVTERRAYLGVSLQDMSRERAREMKVKTETGALVNAVTGDSPAEEAGIKEDDIIVEFNGKAIEDANDLVRAVRKAKPSETASIVLMRKDEKKTLQAKLGKTPKETEFSSLALIPPHISSVPRPKLRMLTEYRSQAYGLQLMTLNKQLGEYFGAPERRGVLVESVEKKSAAEKAGFKAGDVIVKIGQERIEETREIWEALENYEDGDKINVEILRRGTSSTLTLEAEEQEEMGSLFRHESSPWSVQHDLMQEFNSQKFKESMDQFREQMKTMTKKLREEARTIGEKVRHEVLHVVGV